MNSKIEELATACLDELANLTPLSLIDQAFTRIAGMRFPEQNAGAVVSLYRETTRRIASHLSNFDYKSIPQDLETLAQRARELQHLPPKPDEIERIEKTARDLGWTGAEIDIVRVLLKPGETIGKFDERTMEIGSRTWGRYDIREAGRPVWMDREKYLKEFPAIR